MPNIFFDMYVAWLHRILKAISCSSANSVHLLQFLCQFCYKLFKTKHGYLFHLRAAHSVGETPRCPHCGKDDIKSRATYYLHVKKCKAKDNAPWQDIGHCGVICSQTTNEYAHFGAISMYVEKYFSLHAIVCEIFEIARIPIFFHMLGHLAA